MPLTLLDLPQELLLLLASAADDADLPALSETCKATNAIVSDASLRGRLVFGRYLRAQEAELDCMYQYQTFNNILPTFLAGVRYLDSGLTTVDALTAKFARIVLSTLGEDCYDAGMLVKRCTTPMQAHVFLDRFVTYQSQRFEERVLHSAASRGLDTDVACSFQGTCQKGFASVMVQLLLRNKNAVLASIPLKRVLGNVLPEPAMVFDLYACDDVKLYETTRFMRGRDHFTNEMICTTELEARRTMTNPTEAFGIPGTLLETLRCGARNIFRYVVRETRVPCPVTSILLKFVLGGRNTFETYYPIFQAWIEALQPLLAKEEDAFLEYAIHECGPHVVEPLMRDYGLEFSSASALLALCQRSRTYLTSLGASFLTYLKHTRWRRFSASDLRAALANAPPMTLQRRTFLSHLDAHCAEQAQRAAAGDTPPVAVKRTRLT